MPPTDEHERRGHVGHAAERFGRREAMRRGGRLLAGGAAGGALTGWLLKNAEPAFAGSVKCGSLSRCGCQGTQCIMIRGTPCPNRTGDCPGGGQCWKTGTGKCCDYTCSGTSCRCCT